MTLVSALVLAFANGLSVTAASGYFMQWWCGGEAGFRPPFVTHHHMLRSLAVTAVAGPFLLASEALVAHREGRLPSPALGACFVVVPLWMTAIGIVVLSLSEQILYVATVA